MASQSVTLLHNAAQASRTFRVGGAVVASNWADGATVYTVAASKRLILKGKNMQPSNPGTDQVSLQWVNDSGGVTETIVLSAGTILKASGATAFIATGFLEDDI